MTPILTTLPARPSRLVLSDRGWTAPPTIKLHDMALTLCAVFGVSYGGLQGSWVGRHFVLRSIILVIALDLLGYSRLELALAFDMGEPGVRVAAGRARAALGEDHELELWLGQALAPLGICPPRA